MKRGATKEEIIRTTQELIARNGIRAVRVDEIAQTLGISKRTLYEMFADKDELVSACLEAMHRQQRLRILAFRRRRSGNVLIKALSLLNEYVDVLYVVDRSFLADVNRKSAFADYVAEYRSFWHKELSAVLELCWTKGWLLPDVNAAVYAKRLIATLEELRLGGVSREELHLFCRVFLRGVATQGGIEVIDRF